MGSDPFSTGPGPRPTESPRHGGQSARQTESPISTPAASPSPGPASVPSSSSSSGSNFSADLLLEIERLRAERDAMAAELQIERSERLRAEEKLRLYEREKLMQMREGAASREKLASELEESQLRAMRAEARQAAIEADLRLSEIAERRRAYWPSNESEPGANADEVAEPEDVGRTADDESGPEPEPVAAPPKFMRPGQARYTPGSSVSKYSRLARGAARGDAAKPAPGSRTARGDESAAPEGVPGERTSDARGAAARGRTRMSDVEPPNWPSGPGSLPRSDPGAGAGARTTAGRAADASRAGSSAKGSAGAGARGGAAAGRPTLDRTQLEARLAAGGRIEVTERFRQFQPVAQSHIKICDWLARAQTLDEIDNIAAGELARSEIVSVLTLFFERSFLVFKS